jgi:hypothetical protein
MKNESKVENIQKKFQKRNSQGIEKKDSIKIENQPKEIKSHLLLAEILFQKEKNYSLRHCQT